MVRWFAKEWEITPLGWRIFLGAMGALCLFYIAEGIYFAPDAFTVSEFVTERVLRTCIVLVLPFFIATRARGRGRRFGLWLIMAMILNPIVIGIVYWVVVRKEIEKPVDDLAVAPEAGSGGE
jgi:hypothetical protein